VTLEIAWVAPAAHLEWCVPYTLVKGRGGPAVPFGEYT
jgi:hypothetical protein